jgi:TP901 family phage tail tape measure protein
MATRDETLRLQFEVEGIANLRELRTQIDALGDQGKASAADLSKLTDSLANTQALQQSVTRLRELGQQYVTLQQRIREAQAETQKLDAASKEQASSARAIRAAIEEQRIGLERLADAARKGQISEEARQRISAESRAEIKRLSTELRAAETAQRRYDAELESSRGTVSKLTAQQEKLRKPIAEIRGELQQAGVSTRSYAAAQEELKARAASSESAIRELAGAVSQQVAGNRTAAASVQALADANQTLGRRGFGDIREEIKRVQAAYETLRSSGTLSVRELAQAKSAAIERTRQLRAEFGSLGASLRQVQGSLIAAGASLFTVTRLLSDAGRTSAEFSTAMAEVSTLLDDTSGIDGLTESVKELAREFGGPASAQAKALYQIISAGATNAADANRILEQSNKLAVAGVADLKTAADGITSVLNAYGKSSAEAERVSDSFFAAVRAGKTTVDELAGSIGKVAPIAATAGVGFEELSATIATLTQGGVATEQAVTQIRAVLNSVIKPTKEARDAAEALGLEFDLTAVRSKGLAGFLQEVADKTDGNEATIAKLFGSVEGLGAVFALVGKSADNFAANLKSVAEASGSTQTALDKISDTPAQRMARFSASVNQLKIAFGDALAALSPVLEGLTGLLNLFNQLPSPVRTTVAAIGALAAVVTPLAFAITQSRAALVLLSGSLSAAGAAAGTAATATTALGRAFTFLGGPIGIAVAAFGALAAAVSASNQEADARLEKEFEAVKSLREYNDALQARIEKEKLLRAAEDAGRTEQQQSAVDALRKATADLAAVEATLATIRGPAIFQANTLGTAYFGLQKRASDLRGKIEEINTEFERQGLLLFDQGVGVEGLVKAFGFLPPSIANAAQAVQEFAGGAAPSAVDKLAGEIRAVAGDADELAKKLGKLLSGEDFSADNQGLQELSLALAQVAASGDKAGQAIRDSLSAEIGKLSSEQLAGFQAAAERAFAAAGDSASGAAVVLETVFEEGLRRLGVNMEAAGVKISAEGRGIINTFKLIAGSGQASGQAIQAAFVTAIEKARTSGELDALRAELDSAFRAGKIGAEAYQRAIAQAADRQLQLSRGAREAAGEIEDAFSEAGRRAKQELIGSLIAAREGMAREAERLGRELNAALGDPEISAGIRQQLAGVDAQINATTAQINGLQAELQQTGDAGEDGGRRAADALYDIVPAANAAANAADGTAQALGGIGQQAEDAEKSVSKTSGALNGLIQFTKDARDSVAQYGEAALEAFDRTRGELGLVNTTGRSTADVLQLIADRAAFAAKNAQEIATAIGDTAARTERAREAMARFAEQVANAKRELSDLERQLQDEFDRRAGNEEQIRRRQYEDQLRRIDELAASGDAAARSQAARLRELARQNFEADLRDIRARGDAELAEDDRVQRERSRRRGGGVAPGTSGAIDRSRPEDPRSNIEINFNGPTLGSEEELSRRVAAEIERLRRRGTRF